MMMACKATTIYDLARTAEADSIQMAQYLALSHLVAADLVLRTKK